MLLPKDPHVLLKMVQPPTQDYHKVINTCIEEYIGAVDKDTVLKHTVDIFSLGHSVPNVRRHLNS